MDCTRNRQKTDIKLYHKGAVRTWKKKIARKLTHLSVSAYRIPEAYQAWITNFLVAKCWQRDGPLWAEKGQAQVSGIFEQSSKVSEIQKIVLVSVFFM